MAMAVDMSGSHRYPIARGEPVAQPVEHSTFNRMVVGSSPTRLTIIPEK